MMQHYENTRGAQELTNLSRRDMSLLAVAELGISLNSLRSEL